MLEATIRDLQIQPIKGGSPIKLDQALMTKAGLETIDGFIKDHSLLVVTEELGKEGFHNFLTQRTQINPSRNLYVPGTPKLSLIRPEIRNSHLLFTFSGLDEIEDLGDENDSPEDVIPVQVWEYRGNAIEVPILSEWVSDHLNRRLKVARTSGPWNRMARQNFKINDNPLRAQDGYPVHPVSFEDAQEAFKAIGADTDPNRFRYQVLLEGLPIRSIHDYSDAEVNGVTVYQAKPCDRCEVTGNDQEKGEISKYKPLAGLAKSGAPRWIRPDNNMKKAIMGENWLPGGETIIHKGDVVLFKHKRDVPLTFADVQRSA